MFSWRTKRLLSRRRFFPAGQSAVASSAGALESAIGREALGPTATVEYGSQKSMTRSMISSRWTVGRYPTNR